MDFRRAFGLASGITLGIAAVASLPLVAPADDKPDPKKKTAAADAREPSFWMKQKLKYSQAILNGLATEDYDLILTSANKMKRLNRIEYFVKQRPAGYRTHLQTFQHAVTQIAQSAEKKRLDGAALGFTQMTLSCVSCHKTLRSK